MPKRPGQFRFVRTLILSTAVLSAWPVIVLGGSGGWVEFENQTSQRLVAAPGLGVSDPEEKDYAWGDVDHDGDVDIICVRKEGWTTPGRKRNVLFMNEGIGEGHAVNGVFVDRTNDFAAEATDGGQGFLDLTNDRDVILVDVNLDGWLDIVTATTLSEGQPKTISHPRVYMNEGAIDGAWQGFRYEEPRIPQLRALPNGPNVSPRFCAVSAGDVTGDGYPDLYFGEYDQGGARPFDVDDRLLINNGQGYFTDSERTRMTAAMLQSSFGMAVAVVDMNGDGLADIVKDSALDAPTRVSISYNNPTNPGFFNAFENVYTASPYHVSVGDLNQDGRPDLLVTDDGSDRYLLNTGNGADGRANFSQHTYSFAGGGFDDGFGGENLAVDLNNDGHLDAVYTDVDIDAPGCSRRLHLYRNLGNLPNVTLQEQGGAAPWTPAGVHDIAVFDMDGDGWNDMFIGTCTGTQVWINKPPIGIRFTYPTGLPGLIPPSEGATFSVRLMGVGIGELVPNSAVFHVAIGNGAFTEVPMTAIGEHLYEGTFPPNDCTSTYRWYISGMVEGGMVFTDPPAGVAGPFIATAALGTEVAYRDEIESDVSGWTITNDSLFAGAWEQAEPIGSLFSNQLAAPNSDATAQAGAVKAFITKNGVAGEGASQSDVDGGPTYLVSPRIDLAGTDGTISFQHWFFCHNAGTPDADFLSVEVSNNDGVDWVHVTNLSGTNGQWLVSSFQVGAFVPPTADVRVRFGASDNPNNSVTEAGIDDFQVTALICEDEAVAIVSAIPPHGAIDARQTSNPDGTNPAGLQSMDLTFGGAVDGILASAFALSEVGGDGMTAAFEIETLGNAQVRIHLADRIELGAWTCVTHLPSDTRSCVGSLPGDVDANGTSAPTDVLRLIDNLNGVIDPPYAVWQTDIDRSDLSTPADVLRLIDLLNGAGVYEPWLNRELPNLP